MFLWNRHPKPLILLWRWNSGLSAAATARFCVGNTISTISPPAVDWLAETDGTIFAYQDDDGDGLLNAYDYEPGTETAIGGGDLTAGADRIARRTVADF